MMTYSVHPKIYRLENEIQIIERHMRNAQQRMGMNNPAILHNYREMIRTRQELVILLSARIELLLNIFLSANRSFYCL
jgi:hypothetical protein